MVDLPDDEFEDRPELVKKRAQAIIAMRIGWGVLVFYICASLTILVFNAVQSIQTRHTLLDCTQNSGQCHQQSVEQTKESIAQLIDTIIFSDVCIDKPGNQTADEVRACVFQHAQQ